MPIGNAKLLEIFRQELEKIPSRHEDYKRNLEMELADIFNLETQHLITKFNIQQQIDEKCQKLGELLSKHENTDKT